MKTAIVTDTNSSITPQEAKEMGIYLIPMPFFIDGETYLGKPVPMRPFSTC